MVRPTRFDELVRDGRVVEGLWTLGPGHELFYRSEKLDEEVRIRATILDVEPGAILASVTERRSDQKSVTSLVRLAGRWRMNPKNQIIFEIEKSRGRSDVLTFTGGWRVNDHQEIVYSLEETALKRKTKKVRSLTFKGFWDIAGGKGLSYVLGADSASEFRIRGAFGTESILAKKGELRYQAGVETAGRHGVRTIVLFGKWKISRDWGIGFEVEYAPVRKRTIELGGDYRLDDSRQIAVNLTAKNGAPLRIEVIFTRDFFGPDGGAFLRLKKSVEESRLEAGVRFRW